MHEISDFSLQLDRILRNRLSPASNNLRIIAVNEALNPYEEELKQFVKQVKTAIDLVKVEGKNIDEIVRKGKADPHNRIKDFYILFEKIFKRFQFNCIENSFLDFNDLVIQAIEVLKKHEDVRKEYREKYSYVLVDEFQDVNKLQVELLHQLLSDQTSLFCVGDDWQSIYGFRGSDIDFIVNFKNHFPNSKVTSLDINYRSTQTIVSAGNEVMKQNIKKLNKTLHAINTDVSKINVYVSNDEYKDGVKYVTKRIDELLHAGISSDEIMVLGRRSAMLYYYRIAIKSAMQKVTCRTIHSTKGLEARIVFLVGLKSGSGGFPDLWLQDRIYQIIKPQNIDDMKEEERRLFYVAITRAKEELNLITEANNESTYIKEIPAHFLNRVTIEVHSKAQINSCLSCGKTLFQQVKFCSNCGAKLPD